MTGERDRPDPGAARPWSDETLDDVPGGGCPTDDAEAQAWIADQRTVHGLLRAMHNADAATRELRVQSILERVGARSRRQTRVRRGLLLAAALIGAIGLTVWLDPGITELPRADAMVERVLTRLQADSDLRYFVRTSIGSVDGDDGEVSYRRHIGFDLTLRPGKRFLLEGDLALGPIGVVRAGCDGEILWARADGFPGFSVPLSRAQNVERMLRNTVEIVDFDLESLVAHLRDAADRLEVHRLDPDGEQRQLIRVEARELDLPRRGRALRSVILDVEEQTGLLYRAELAIRPRPQHARRLVFEYRGSAALGESAYRRPW